jgi:diguanylate cyclase (GGDEF)-like protein
MASSRRTNRPFTLMLLDLNGFKEVNDSLGHLQGDQLLNQIAQRLRSHTRDSDTIARLGGDEFAMLCPETDEIGANTLAGKVRQIIVQPLVLDGRECAVTASIGLAVYPHNGTTEESLLRFADAAMYADKRSEMIRDASA